MLLKTLYLLILAIIIIIFGLWIYPMFFGASFEPSSNKAIKGMIELSGIKSSDKKKIKFADIGSGNGKVAIAFAKLNPNIEVHGYEIDPILTWVSKRKVKMLGLQDRVFIHRKNFWKQNFKDFDIITTFQINYAMHGLEKKFQKELKKGAKVISNTWKFYHWKPKEKISYGLGDVILYVKE